MQLEHPRPEPRARTLAALGGDASGRPAEPPASRILRLPEPALGAYAQALGHAWRTLGIGAGDRVVIYDHGSSPIAYLASAAFAPYLAAGAAELTGALALCVDGLPDNVSRLGHVMAHFEPTVLFVRADVASLLVAGPTALPAAKRHGRMVVSCDGALPSARERASWEERWPGGAAVIARCDRAAFLVAERPCGGVFDVPGELYDTRLAGAGAVGRGAPGGDAQAPPGAHVPRTLSVRARFLGSGLVETALVGRDRARGALELL